MTKSELRGWAKKRRASLPMPEYSEKMCGLLASLLQGLEARHVLLYSAFGSEPDPSGVTALHRAQYYLPRTLDKTLTVHPLPARLERHPLGFLEPVKGSPAASPKILQAVIVPGLAFDKKGFRLGYGAGYYDRFLEGPETTSPYGLNKASRIGLVPEALILERLPQDEWDQQMDYLISENRVIHVKRDRQLLE